MSTMRRRSVKALIKDWTRDLVRLFTGRSIWFGFTSVIAGMIAFGEWGTSKDKSSEQGSSNYVPIPLDITAAQAGEAGVPTFNGMAQLNPNTLFGVNINGTTAGGGSGFAVRNESASGGDGLYGSTASDITGANGFAGVHGENTSPEKINGFGVVGTTQSQGGAGVGGFAGAGDAVGVLGYTSSDSRDSAGVKAQYAGNGAGTALAVLGGAIKMTGAGVGTNTAAFIHVVTNSNNWGFYTCIDHVLTNGDPNAILIMTANGTPRGSRIPTPGPDIIPARVVYATPESLPEVPEWHGKWCIKTRALSPYDVATDLYPAGFIGTSFNILVIKT